jgi:hypothetical protein
MSSSTDLRLIGAFAPALPQICGATPKVNNPQRNTSAIIPGVSVRVKVGKSLTTMGDSQDKNFREITSFFGRISLSFFQETSL